MKKSAIPCLHFLALILFSAPALAAGPVSTNGIASVSFQNSDFFLNADDWPNPNNCTRGGSVVLLKTDPNYDKAYALLLSAYMSGKGVSGYSDGCINFDGQTYNTIRGFKYLTVHEPS
ncbi:MAG: hypothetical protein ABJN65_00970 [Parasphingorhabdus sp.]